MLNELLIIQRGAPQRLIDSYQRHPDLKDVGRRPTLRVRLDASGRVASVDPIPVGLTLWTLGKGNKRRFPYLQPNAPLMRSKDEKTEKKLESLHSLRADKRRKCVLWCYRDKPLHGCTVTSGVRNSECDWQMDRTARNT